MITINNIRVYSNCYLKLIYRYHLKFAPSRQYHKRTRLTLSSRTLIRSLSESTPATPWEFSFQCNERYLEWDVSAQRRLLKLVASQQLDLSIEEIDTRLMSLFYIIPDLASKFEKMKASLLIDLIKDTESVASKVLTLKLLLPDLDVSLLVYQFPQILLQEEAAIKEKAAEINSVMGDPERMQQLIEKEPRYLIANIKRALSEAMRLIPDGNPADHLLAMPEKFLTMDELGLESAKDVEGF